MSGTSICGSHCEESTPVELMQESWTMFAVGERGSPTCLPLRSVGHVTHVESALEILADGFFSAKMVADSVGPLGNMQLKVLFTSPYDCEKNGDGYRFGNVAFMFDWRALIKGKNYY